MKVRYKTTESALAKCPFCKKENHAKRHEFCAHFVWVEEQGKFKNAGFNQWFEVERYKWKFWRWYDPVHEAISSGSAE